MRVILTLILSLGLISCAVHHEGLHYLGAKLVGEDVNIHVEPPFGGRWEARRDTSDGKEAFIEATPLLFNMLAMITIKTILATKPHFAKSRFGKVLRAYSVFNGVELLWNSTLGSDELRDISRVTEIPKPVLMIPLVVFAGWALFDDARFFLGGQTSY